MWRKDEEGMKELLLSYRLCSLLSEEDERKLLSMMKCIKETGSFKVPKEEKQ